MKEPLQLRISRADKEVVWSHLHRNDLDEHACLLLCGMVTTERGTRLLVRRVVLAEDGVDFVPSKRGYKELTTAFMAKWSTYCADEKLVYLAAHNHFSENSVAFSSNDLESHDRCYPSLKDIVGGPVGAVVFGTNAVAGDVWFDEGRCSVDSMVVVGPRVDTLRPIPLVESSDSVGETYDRQSRMFGQSGQLLLGALKVVIMGAGGGGSLLSQWLAHLGIGHLVVVDPDTIEQSNRPRVVGSTDEDVEAKLPKVQIAERVARAANPQIRFEAVCGDERDADVAAHLYDADIIILAGDSYRSRLVFNAAVHQFLVPGFHIGAHVLPDPLSGELVEVKVESRVVIPESGGGCLLCNGFVPSSKLREESLSPDERSEQGYGGQVFREDAPEPSVIALNVMSAAPVLNDLMMMFTGLYRDDVELESKRYMALDRKTYFVVHKVDETCLHCGPTNKSCRAKGETCRLPFVK